MNLGPVSRQVIVVYHSSHDLVVRAGHRPLRDELAVWQPCLVVRYSVGPWEV